MPSRIPSITGLVITIDATRVVVEDLSPNEVEELTNLAVDAFNVALEDVTTDVTYTTSGSMTLLIPDDISEDEIVNAIESSLAEALGVHPHQIAVDVNMETGEVEYTVTSEEYYDGKSVSK